MSSKRGGLFIVSAPSGSGKTTLVEQLVRGLPSIRMSRSYTSRAAREGEQEGVDYNFVTRERFEAFLEWADVFGNYYGTGAADTEAHLLNGDDVVLVIDVQGAREVRRKGFNAIAIFVLPPSASVLEERLRGRSKDSDEQIRRRLGVACSEVGEYGAYDYVVVNDEVASAVDSLRAIVLAERAKMESMRPTAEAIIGTFRPPPDGPSS
jgi:guanylate kinase